MHNYLQQYQSTSLEDFADSILRKNHITRPEDINLEKLVEKERYLKLIYRETFSGNLQLGHKALIYIDTRIPYRKQREILAEEYIHFKWHVANQLTSPYSVIDKQEEQAKKMAAYLLIPTFMLKDIKIINDRYADTERLADIFYVTYEFMEYRLNLIFNQRIKAITYNNGQAYAYVPCEYC